MFQASQVVHKAQIVTRSKVDEQPNRNCKTYDSYDVSDEPRDYPNPLSRKFASFVNGCKVICIIFFSVSIRCRPFLLVLLMIQISVLHGSFITSATLSFEN